MNISNKFQTKLEPHVVLVSKIRNTIACIFFLPGMSFSSADDTCTTFIFVAHVHSLEEMFACLTKYVK